MWDIDKVLIHDGDLSRLTAGHVEVPVRVYRTDGFPTIFAGFQVNWVDGDDPESGAEFSLSAGAGVGSKYMTLRVEIPGRETVYEYVDITELLQQRVAAIIAEEGADA